MKPASKVDSKVDHKIIFIVGASRSGTTMVSRILGMHGSVFALNELHVFGDLLTVPMLQKTLLQHEQSELADAILRRQEHGIWNADKPLSEPSIVQQALAKLGADKATAADVFQHSVLTVAQQQDKQHVAEQTPRNIFFAQALLDAYPQAHVVHMIRDPRAVLASQKSKWRRKFLGGTGIPFLEMVRMWTNYHPITLSKLWVNANQIALNMQAHPRFHLVKFEDLLTSPESVLSELCQSMGLEFESRMMEIDHIGSSHQHNVSKASGISDATIDSWKSSLSPAEQWVSEKMCKSVMKHFAYTNVSSEKIPMWSMLVLLLRFPIHILGVALFNFKRAVIQMKSMFVRESD